MRSNFFEQFHCNKKLVYLLLIAFINFTNCVVYRNMAPTGNFTTLEKRNRGEVEAFQLLKAPTPYDPNLELQLGMVATHLEKRNVELKGEKKSTALLWGGAMLTGAGVVIASNSGGPNSPDSLEYAGGLLAAIIGGIAFIGFFGQKWQPATKNALQDTLITDPNEFTPISNTKIRVKAEPGNSTLNLVTDDYGRIIVDIEQFASQGDTDTSLVLSFSSVDYKNAKFSYAIPSLFFVNLRQHTDFESQLDYLAEQISSNLTKGRRNKIAVLDFQDLHNRTTEFGKFLSEELITRLFRTSKFDVVERRLLNKVMEEHKLSASGLLDETSIRKLGKLLGVDAIVSGTMTDLGNSLKVNTRLISTETAALFAVAAAEFLKDENIRKLLGEKR